MREPEFEQREFPVRGKQAFEFFAVEVAEKSPVLRHSITVAFLQRDVENSIWFPACMERTAPSCIVTLH